MALLDFLVPIAKRLVFRTVVPAGPVRHVYRLLHEGQVLGREAYEWGWRALVATPTFLSYCERHGDGISVDIVPYIIAPCRIELGSNIRISGKICISGVRGRRSLLRIGDGVFIGHGTSFTVASRIELGNYVGIGGGSFITDTEGHDKHTGQLKPAWEAPAGEDDIAPVIIEDGVWIGRHVAILKGVRIGARSIIGYGAVIRSDVPPDSVVAGNPARVIPPSMLRPRGAARPTSPSG